MSALKAIVLGSGYADEGHTIALQHARVEVVAMASRNEKVCRQAAATLGIPRWGTDWKALLREIRPDIVAVEEGDHLAACRADPEIARCRRPAFFTGQKAQP